MNHEKQIGKQRTRRRFRVRNRLKADASRPRLSVFRSGKHMYAQVIDDQSGRTLASASTRDKSLVAEFKQGGNCTAAKRIGEVVAQKALAAGVQEVCFDRREYRYHGRVKALAEGARAAGLQF